MLGVVLLAHLAPLFQASPAVAQEEPAEAAQRLWSEGLDALEREAFEEAVALFERSMELNPRASTAFNLAFALRSAGRLLEALSWVDQLESGDVGQMSEGQVAEVSLFREQIETEMGHLVVTTVGVGQVQVTVDAIARGVVGPGSELRLRVDPGSYEVVAASDAAPNQEQEVRVTAGAAVPVHFAFSDPVVPTIPPPVLADDSATVLRPDPSLSDDESGDGVLVWSLVIAGALAIGGAIALGFLLVEETPSDVLGTARVLR